MIQASLKDSKSIESLHPLFAKAFEFLKNSDFSKMENGRYELQGKDLYVNVQSITGKEEQNAAVETHKNYIDIQLPLEGVERIGWIPTADLKEVTKPYNPEKDIEFFAERPTTVATIVPGQFAIFFPEDGHAPGIGDGAIRKIVVKVKI